jgi:hypothetical protein
MDFLIPSASFGISMAFSASSKTEAALIFCSVCVYVFFEAVKKEREKVRLVITSSSRLSTFVVVVVARTETFSTPTIF